MILVLKHEAAYEGIYPKYLVTVIRPQVKYNSGVIMQVVWNYELNFNGMSTTVKTDYDA